MSPLIVASFIICIIVNLGVYCKDDVTAGVAEGGDVGAVIEMNGNMAGYQYSGTTNNNINGVYKEVVQSYVGNNGQCVNLVILSIHDMEAQRLKVHCTGSSRGVNGHYQYGSAFTFRPESGNNNVFKGLFNMEHGTCVRKTYTAVKGFFNKRVVVSPDMPTTDQECQDLAQGRNLIGGTVSNSWSQSGATFTGNDKPVSVVNNLINGLASTKPDDDASGVVEEGDKGSVIEMNGDMAGYRYSGTTNNNNNGVYKEVVLSHVGSNGECVNLVILSIHDMEAQRLKVHCTGSSSRGVNGHHQYGSAFTFRPEPGNNVFKGLFNMGDGTCVRKTYTAMTGFFNKKVVVSPDIPTTDQECQDIAQGRDLIGGTVSTSLSQSGATNTGNDKPVGVVNNSPTTTKPNDQNGHEEGHDNVWGEEKVAEEGGEGEDEEDLGEWEDDDGEEEWEDDDVEGEWEEEEDMDHGNVEPIKPTMKPENTQTETDKEDYQTINKQKVAVLSSNVLGYQIEGDSKIIEGSSYTFTFQKYMKPGTEECFKMVTVSQDDEVKENVKISCEYEDPGKKRGLNLHIDGVIYEKLPFNVIYVVKDGLCLNKNYFEFAKIKEQILSEQECTELTGRSQEERISGVIPGTEPISAKDFAVMEDQIVAVLKGSVKGFTPKEESTYTTTSYKVEVQDFVKDGQCVKVVSLRRDDHDQYLEQVKVPCKVIAPVITDDEDIEMNFGNLIYIQKSMSVVYVVENGICLERTYYVVMDEVKFNERILGLPECFTLTRWRQEQRSTSEKLNQQPPPKTEEAPGLMWMLSLNGNPKNGFTEWGGSTNVKGNALSLELQEFVEEERCVRKVTLRIQNGYADTFLVSCGALNGINMIGDKVQYGKAFLVVPGPSDNTYVARFNFRERSCVKKTYTVKKGNPVRLFKSQVTRVTDKECKALMQGNNNNMIVLNGGGMVFNNGGINIG